MHYHLTVYPHWKYHPLAVLDSSHNGLSIQANICLLADGEHDVLAFVVLDNLSASHVYSSIFGIPLHITVLSDA